MKDVPIAFLLIFRSPKPRPKCQCGKALDARGTCRECEWEAPESGPRSMRPEELRKVGH
jgi:hypothetical protein